MKIPVVWSARSRRPGRRCQSGGHRLPRHPVWLAQISWRGWYRLTARPVFRHIEKKVPCMSRIPVNFVHSRQINFHIYNLSAVVRQKNRKIARICRLLDIRTEKKLYISNQTAAPGLTSDLTPDLTSRIDFGIDSKIVSGSGRNFSFIQKERLPRSICVKPRSSRSFFAILFLTNSDSQRVFYNLIHIP